MNSGEPDFAKYTWEVVPENGTATDLGIIDGDTATIIWDGPLGFYSLKVSVLDGNGCISDTIIQQIEIIEPGDFIINAGRDTTIGICSIYNLKATLEKQPEMTYSYLWEPGNNLDDPTSATPIFTPGSTTFFKLTVTNSTGETETDSVIITVSELIANAGDNMGMYENSPVMLDATGCSGEDLSFLWTTIDGAIDEGEDTAFPIVSGYGYYYLQLKDKYNCIALDTVNVFETMPPPVGENDFDTTYFGHELIIDVLKNDSIPEGLFDPSSMYIAEQPFYGTAYIDYNDFTVHYRPDLGFSGTDIFEYQYCDTFKNCTYANVYVYVNDYDFLIPDAFSPNGDGINDYFEIIGIKQFAENKISIFNRWGNKVYESVRYGISSTPLFWDGKSNTGFLMGNEDLPSGTYYYVLKLGRSEKPVAGSIYLDR